MSELPKGWTLCSLGEIGLWSSGGTPSRTNRDFFGGTIHWIKSGDLPDGPILRTDEAITELGLEQSAAKLLPVNTICIALYGATIGRLGITTFPAATNQAVANLIPNLDLINVKYAFYFLKSARSYFVGLGQGGAQPNISQQIVRETEIPIAPFAEQKRIADKLDVLLSRVDSCRERLDRVPAILKRFRQSVLAAATSGKLTDDWRGDPSNSTGLPSTWTNCLIKDAGRIQLGRQRSPKFHAGDNMRPYLRVQNVFEDRIDLSDVMTMDFPGEDFVRYKLSPGDILLNEGQSPQFLGRPAIYRGELPDCCFTNTLIRFQANNDVLPDYAMLVFRNHMHSGRYVTEGRITTNIAHLGAGRFGTVEFPKPSLEEQVEIVRRTRILLAHSTLIESTLAGSIHRIQRLTPSILDRAFRGELVPQDPDNEPAEELLNRINDNKATCSRRAKRARIQKVQV